VTTTTFDEEVLNTEVRKFLKRVGITSQREIEMAVRRAAANAKLPASAPLKAEMVLSIPALGLSHRIEGEIALG